MAADTSALHSHLCLSNPLGKEALRPATRYSIEVTVPLAVVQGHDRGLALMYQPTCAVLSGGVLVPALEQPGAAELLLHCVQLLLCPHQWLLVWPHLGTNCPKELGTCSVKRQQLFMHNLQQQQTAVVHAETCSGNRQQLCIQNLPCQQTAVVCTRTTNVLEGIQAAAQGEHNVASPDQTVATVSKVLIVLSHRWFLQRSPVGIIKC